MIVGIDSSGNKSVICVVFGSNENIHNVYVSMCGAFKTVGWSPPLHWKSLKKQTRKKLAPSIAGFLNASDLKIWVIETKRPMGKEAKDYYLREVPNKLAYLLEPLIMSTYGVLQIQADRDFEISKTRNTGDFLKYLVEKITFRAHGSYVRVFETGGGVSAYLKKDERHLKITAAAVSSENSEAVQIADIILGVRNADKTRIKCRLFKV